MSELVLYFEMKSDILSPLKLEGLVRLKLGGIQKLAENLIKTVNPHPRKCIHKHTILF